MKTSKWGADDTFAKNIDWDLLRVFDITFQNSRERHLGGPHNDFRKGCQKLLPWQGASSFKSRQNAVFQNLPRFSHDFAPTSRAADAGPHTVLVCFQTAPHLSLARRNLHFLRRSPILRPSNQRLSYLQKKTWKHSVFFFTSLSSVLPWLHAKLDQIRAASSFHLDRQAW